MKALIILLYYDRPNLVHNALNSIRMLKYENYEVAVIDDGSKIPIEPIVRMHYYDIVDKFKFYRCNDTIEQKLRQGGTRRGLFVNEAINNSDADFAIILCDDDAITHSYFNELIKWFKNNPGKVYGYCYVLDFNPLIQLPNEKVRPRGRTNIIILSNDVRIINSSQVAWLLKVNRENGMRFSEIQDLSCLTDGCRTAFLTATFFNCMHQKYGVCSFMGMFGQYKGRFHGQLGNRKETYSKTEG